MDLSCFYDQYWTKKEDIIDHDRLEMMIAHLQPGSKTLDINCGNGIFAHKMKNRSMDVTVTDQSQVALQKTVGRGIEKAFWVDLDTQRLPFEDQQFDSVISNSMIEHFFFPERVISEGTRVLKKGGIFIILVPNIGHWKFRFLLLMGRFPYQHNTPTDMLHIRFFTLHSLKALCRKHGLRVKKIQGNAGLWCRNLYPIYIKVPPLKQAYLILTWLWPSLFAKDVLVVLEK